MTCPSCGAEIPAETGQHAVTPVADLVACPSCGAHVRLVGEGTGGDVERAEAAPPGRVEGRETFAGEETVEGVMEELREKEGGPE
jgi:hypothetical protein